MGSVDGHIFFQQQHVWKFQLILSFSFSGLFRYFFGIKPISLVPRQSILIKYMTLNWSAFPTWNKVLHILLACVCFNTAIRNRSVLESQEQDSYFWKNMLNLKSQWVADEVTLPSLKRVWYCPQKWCLRLENWPWKYQFSFLKVFVNSSPRKK